MSKPVRIFMSLLRFDNKCQEAKSQQIVKMFQKMAICHISLYITIKSEEVNKPIYLKSIGDRLGRWEKAKGGGQPLGWTERKMIYAHLFPYVGPG